jgi:hypothetical protein
VGGRISRLALGSSGATTRSDCENCSWGGKRKVVDATKVCASLWQQETEHWLMPSPPWWSQGIGDGCGL